MSARAGAVPAIARLVELRTALASRHIPSALVIRDRQPCLRLDELDLLITLHRGSFAWCGAASSGLGAGRVAAHSVGDAADCLSNAINEALAARAPYGPMPPPGGAGGRPRRGSVSEIEVSAWHPELWHVGGALAYGFLSLAELALPELVPLRERETAAFAAAVQLGQTLSLISPDVFVLPFNPWVSVIRVCSGFVVITDGRFYVWPDPQAARTAVPRKLISVCTSLTAHARLTNLRNWPARGHHHLAGQLG